MRELTNPERNAILAALRLWQNAPVIPTDILNLATENGAHEPLTLEESDRLCEDLNLTDNVILKNETEIIPGKQETFPKASYDLKNDLPDFRETSRLLMNMMDRQLSIIDEQAKMIQALTYPAPVIVNPSIPDPEFLAKLQAELDDKITRSMRLFMEENKPKPKKDRYSFSGRSGEPIQVWDNEQKRYLTSVEAAPILEQYGLDK